MFKIAKQAAGGGGAFVKLIHFASEDFAVIVRYPFEGKLHHVYVGPDPGDAEEAYNKEVEKMASREELQTSGPWTIP